VLIKTEPETVNPFDQIDFGKYCIHICYQYHNRSDIETNVHFFKWISELLKNV